MLGREPVEMMEKHPVGTNFGIFLDIPQLFFAYSGPFRPQGHIMNPQRRFAPIGGLFKPESVAGLARMRRFG
jgi:hypothetical protein